MTDDISFLYDDSFDDVYELRLENIRFKEYLIRATDVMKRNDDRFTSDIKRLSADNVILRRDLDEAYRQRDELAKELRMMKADAETHSNHIALISAVARSGTEGITEVIHENLRLRFVLSILAAVKS